MIASALLSAGFILSAKLERTAPAARIPVPVAPAIPPLPIVLRPPPTTSEAIALFTKDSHGPESERDEWVHPLYGPRRVLPIRNTRRFGAAREGLRPDECRDGHCGVDLGSDRGDPVLAAHDGVIERIQRDPDQGGRIGNEGRFVRINHLDSTVVTTYIHLDTIRANLRTGQKVKAGEPIGTVGSTGVQHSGPHLHFAVSVRKGFEESELYIDPEPLLHLWAVRAPPSAPTRKLASSDKVVARASLSDED